MFVGRFLPSKTRRILLTVFLILGAWGGAWWFFHPNPVADHSFTPNTLHPKRALSLPKLPRIPFQDITDEAGLDYVQENGASGEKLLPEVMSGGCAFFDYDGDGDQDLLLVNAQRWPWDEREPPEVPPTMALYQNDGTGQFKNVTANVGINVSLYGMGCAVGDFDNDGDPDLFVTAIGKNRLFRNDAGVFTDITETSGVGGKESDWGSSCGWFDCDNDGDLDLWVCHYVQWSRALDHSKTSRLKPGGRAYGRPIDFKGCSSTLYLNEGDGRFRDISRQAGILIMDPISMLMSGGKQEPTPLSKGLGVVFVDINHDGKLDVMVANDTVQNLLFQNKGRGKFAERASASGVAVDEKGKAHGAMGIDAGYFRPGEDTLGIVIGNFYKEMSSLYVNQPSDHWSFSDLSGPSGMGPLSAAEVRFGVFFFDPDLDSRLDFFEANGQVESDANLTEGGGTFAEPAHLFWNAGQDSPSEFVMLTAEQCGDDLFRPLVGRGAIYADIDGDGDQDLLISTCTGQPRLLRNDLVLGDHWFRFLFIGAGKSNRDAIGTYVELFTEGQKLIQMVSPTKSYLSQVELPITFGLGSHNKIDRVEIRWPDGTRQKLVNVKVDRLHEIRQPVTE